MIITPISSSKQLSSILLITAATLEDAGCLAFKIRENMPRRPNDFFLGTIDKDIVFLLQEDFIDLDSRTWLVKTDEVVAYTVMTSKDARHAALASKLPEMFK